MKLLEKTIASIAPPSITLSAEVSAVLASHRPLYFGRLEDALLRYISITGERHPAPPQTSVVISCADHGVAAESVSAYPPETTLNMMCNYLISHGGAANAVANYAGAQLIVADLGVNADTEAIPGLVRRSIAPGTANMAKGPAMTREQAIQSVETGIALAHARADAGDRCILPGEMGISNTTSSAAIVAALLQVSPEEVTGRGANISDERLRHKVEIVRRALAVNTPDPANGLDVLAKVGGFELGCIAGLILGAAARHMLVVLDGANTASAALIAHAIAPACVHFMLASHASLTEHSQPHALSHMGLTPMLRLDIRLSEAAGSSIVLQMLNQMIAVWDALDSAEIPPLLSSDTMENRASSCAPAALIPLPKQNAMEACQYRLDNLAKPIHSLGYLEQIAVQLAGITGSTCPPLDLKACVLLAAPPKGLSPVCAKALSAMASAARIPVHVISSSAEGSAFASARRQAHALSRSYPLLILGAAEGTEDALCGALWGAAESGTTLILPGDAEADCIARRCAKENPRLQPYILHFLPDMIAMDTALSTGMTGILGMSIIRSALHIVNDMKTFTETGVAVAIDGVGAGRQVHK